MYGTSYGIILYMNWNLYLSMFQTSIRGRAATGKGLHKARFMQNAAALPGMINVQFLAHTEYTIK